MSKCIYSHILWDWNGTLLNDVDWCLSRTNLMLQKRNKKPFKSLADYHKAFCFPVFEYYKNAGFDFSEEPFEILAKEFIDLYHGEGSVDICLHENTRAVLQYIQKEKVPQSILSASARQNLMAQVESYGIREYFDEILGITDIYANSKVEIGLEYLRKHHVQKGLMIGDTVHDFEVAQAMGIDCVLVAKGHQDKNILLSCGVSVFENLNEVLSYIF